MSENNKLKFKEMKRMWKDMKKDQQAIEPKEETIEKTARNEAMDNKQKLYMKLVLARNRLNQHNAGNQNVYDNIMKIVKEARTNENFPEDCLEEIENALMKCELPDNIINDTDVQEYYSEEKFEPIISNPIPLQQMLKKHNVI